MVKSLINISICGTRIGYLVMRVILIAVPKEETFDEVGGSKDCFSISKTEFGHLMEAMGTAYCEEAHRRT